MHHFEVTQSVLRVMAIKLAGTRIKNLHATRKRQAKTFSCTGEL